MSNTYRLQSCYQVCLMCFLAVSGTTGIANGQVLDPLNPFAQLGDPEETQKEKFETQMQVRIDEMQRVCELGDKQVRQLQIGAKGTVARSMVLWKKQARALQNQMGGALAGLPVARPVDPEEEGGDDEDSDEGADADDEEDAGAPINQQVFSVMTQMMLGDIPPERQKIWKNVVRKVLTDAQRTQLEESDNARRAFNRKTGVMNRVQSLDVMLRFSQTQREQVTEVVDRVLGKTLERDDGPKLSRTTMIYGDEAEVLPKHLKDILSAPQLKAFEESEAAASNPMAAAMQIGMGGRRRAMQVPGTERGGSYLGISFTMSGFLANMNKTIVHQVVPDGPADKAGLQSQDVLKKFGDADVANAMTFLTSLRTYKPGQEVEVVFERDGEEMTVTVVLTKRE